MIPKLRYLFLIIILCGLESIRSLSIYNDLSSQYEDLLDSQDSQNEASERRWLLLESIQALASLMIRNITQICPLNQHEYIIFAEKIVRTTLASIYEKEETLKRIQFYDRILPAITSTLNSCLQSSSTRISIQEFYSRNYPQKILHLDLLQNAGDASKWYDFRKCIRMRDYSQFYPGLISSVIDTFWNSFLIGYYGCMDFWVALDSWSYMDAIHTTILYPIYKRWKFKFPSIPSSKSSLASNKTDTEDSTEPEDSRDKIGSVQPAADVSTVKYMLNSLEKCNIILFMKNPSDPIPCFKDLIQEIENDM